MWEADEEMPAGIDPAKWSELQALFGLLPPTSCIGKCQNACTSGIDVQPIEITMLGEAGQLLAPPGSRPEVRLRGCPLLTPEGKCSVYRNRPFICRFWGSVEWMKCSYGCIPDTGFLDDVQALTLVLRWILLGLDAAAEQAKVKAMIRRIRHEPHLRQAWINRIHVHSNRVEDYGPEAMQATDMQLYMAINHPPADAHGRKRPKRAKR